MADLAHSRSCSVFGCRWYVVAMREETVIAEAERHADEHRLEGRDE